MHGFMALLLTWTIAVAVSPAVVAVDVAVAAETSHFAIFVADATPRIDVFVCIGR